MNWSRSRLVTNGLASYSKCNCGSQSEEAVPELNTANSSGLGHSSLKSVFRTFSWLFVSLSALALLSAPDATHDETFHLATIYCGVGEREPFCGDLRFDITYPGANVKFNFQTCQKEPTSALACPVEQANYTFRSINHGNLYPGLFHSVLSFAIVPSSELSIVLTRWTSALLVTIALAFATYLLPQRQRLVAFLVMLTALPATGYFLFASINPSSWTLVGVAFAWLPLHAILEPVESRTIKKLPLLVSASLLVAMGVGSRWDALPFIALTFSYVAVSAIVAQNKDSKNFKYTVIIIFVVLALSVVIVDKLTPLHAAPLRFLGPLTTFSSGEPDNVAFFSHYLMNAPAAALRALGTVPTKSGLVIPEFVYVAGLFALAYTMALTRNIRNTPQMIGLLVNAVVISLVTMAQVALIDSRDPFGVEPRYVVPLLAFTVGWWFVTGPRHLIDIVGKRLLFLCVIAITTFGLISFSVAERYVDRQTFGIRILPEGADNWWWSQLPIGPNVIVVISVFSIGKFFLGYRKSLLL